MLIGRPVLFAISRDRCGISINSCSENDCLFFTKFGLECYLSLASDGTTDEHSIAYETLLNLKLKRQRKRSEDNHMIS